MLWISISLRKVCVRIHHNWIITAKILNCFNSQQYHSRSSGDLKNGDEASLINPHSLQAYPQGTDRADNRFGSMEDTGQFCLALLLYSCAFPHSQLQNQPCKHLVKRMLKQTSNPHVHLNRCICHQIKHLGSCDHSKTIWTAREWRKGRRGEERRGERRGGEGGEGRIGRGGEGRGRRGRGGGGGGGEREVRERMKKWEIREKS